MGPHAIRAAIAAVIVGAATPAAAADGTIPEHPALSDRFYFGAGVFLPQTSTSAQLQSKAGVGANVDFENALGRKEFVEPRAKVASALDDDCLRIGDVDAEHF